MKSGNGPERSWPADGHHPNVHANPRETYTLMKSLFPPPYPHEPASGQGTSLPIRKQNKRKIPVGGRWHMRRAQCLSHWGHTLQPLRADAVVPYCDIAYRAQHGSSLAKARIGRTGSNGTVWRQPYQFTDTTRHAVARCSLGGERARRKKRCDASREHDGKAVAPGTRQSVSRRPAKTVSRKPARGVEGRLVAYG